jgi:hypothetical protein
LDKEAQVIVLDYIPTATTFDKNIILFSCLLEGQFFYVKACVFLRAGQAEEIGGCIYISTSMEPTSSYLHEDGIIRETAANGGWYLSVNHALDALRKYHDSIQAE